jgi:hypothetical protein
MWGTFMLDVYRHEDAADVRDALERILGPEEASGWATGGVYVFWNPQTREPRYVGITGDFPERFAQHNGLRGSSRRGSKRKQITQYFATEGESLGFTVLALSSLNQPSTHRQRRVLALKEPELIELNESLSAEVVNEMRALEGRLIAAHTAMFGTKPPWNVSPGRRPTLPSDGARGVLSVAVGAFDCLLQARHTIRALASDGEARLFEEQLHGVRILMAGGQFTNTRFRKMFDKFWGIDDRMRQAIVDSSYLDHRNPVTVGPVIDGTTTWTDRRGAQGKRRQRHDY